MTLEESLLRKVDGTVEKLGTTRSALIRDSIRHYLRMLEVQELEKRHREAYRKKPVKPGEFDIWESEHEWGGE
jgi:metal-responsive CopG/Arc/MetJ family transcriptional regulator